MITEATLDRLDALKADLATQPRPAPPLSRHEFWVLQKRIRSCEAKTAFTSRMDAEHRLRKLQQNIEAGIKRPDNGVSAPVAVYQCVHCGHWHMTGVPQ